MKTKNKFASQAICTRYLGPTNNRGGRIKAYCERGSVTIDYPNELSIPDAHALAAETLLKRFSEEDKAEYGSESNWWGTIDQWTIGALPQNCRDAYVFCKCFFCK